MGRIGALALWLVAITACFDPTIREGALCPTGECPGDLVCLDGVCLGSDCTVPVSHATIADLVADDSCPEGRISSGRYVENVVIDGDKSLTGVGPSPPVIDGGAAGSVVRVMSGTVRLESLVITGGLSPLGGGIDSRGDLTLVDVQVEMNTATGAGEDVLGGGIYQSADGSLVIENGAIINNSIDSRDAALAAGGGVASEAPLSVSGTEIRGNTIAATAANSALPTAFGAGVYVSGASAAFDAVIVADNTATAEHTGTEIAGARGGGIYVSGGSCTVDGSSTITGNRAEASGPGLVMGAVGSLAEGGGLYVADGSLQLRNSAVSDNSARGEGSVKSGARGGGVMIANPSDVGIADVDIAANRAEGPNGLVFGGGAVIDSVVAGADVMATVDRTSIRNNEASTQPGGDTGSCGGMLVVVRGAGSRLTFEITNSTISGNTLDTVKFGFCGGFALTSHDGADAAFRGQNITVSGNRILDGGTGGGMTLDAPEIPLTARGTLSVQLRFATIASNRVEGASGTAGGLRLEVPVVTGSLSGAELSHVVIDDNVAPTAPDCETPNGSVIDSGGFNMIVNASGCSLGAGVDATSVAGDAALTPLADAGGPTQTQVPVEGSPAVDGGDPAGCLDLDGNPLVEDQRGSPRPVGSACDVGAVEVQ